MIAQNRFETLNNKLNSRQQYWMRRASEGDEVARLWLSPTLAMPGLDQWQVKVLKQLVPFERDVICNCSRQVGKSTVISLAAYLRACTGQFVLVISASDRQAMEFLAKLKKHHTRLNLVPTYKDTDHEILFNGGGHILALPKSETTIVGFSALDLLVIDEAAKVPDNIYNAVRPMLITSRGQTALLSSPFGQRGFFYQEWISASSTWKRFRVSWRDCPRIQPRDVERERNRPGVIVEQEYLDCEEGKEFLPTAGGFFNVPAWSELQADIQMEY